MTYAEALKKSVRECATALADAYLWSEFGKAIKNASWAILCLVTRAAILLTYPVSVPLVAVAVMLDDRKRKEQRNKVRGEIHAHYGKLTRQQSDKENNNG